MPSSFPTRQYADAFNQPLSLDTSSVTDMSYMFYVRSTPALSAALHNHELHIIFYASPLPALLPICSRALPCTLRAPRSSAA